LRVGAPDVGGIDVHLDRVAVRVMEVDALRHRVILDRVDRDAERVEVLLARRRSSIESPALKATWYKPGLSAGESGVPAPSATMARSWWFPRVKNVIGGVSPRAAIRSPRTSV
jgi:hypothetical protein